LKYAMLYIFFIVFIKKIYEGFKPN